MRKLSTARIFVFCILCTVSIQVTGQPGRRIIVSPEIRSDKTIIFRYLAPDADKVELSAQFLKERQLMVKDTSGLWSFIVGPVVPDIYPYSFYVDGIQVNDPNNTLIFPNERFKSSLVDIPGETPLIHSMQDVPHGKVIYRYYKSKSLDLIRPLVIYTPPGYNQNLKKKYPVLYIIHGGGEDERGWATQGRTDIILDNLLAEGKAIPMLVVMLDSNVLLPGSKNYAYDLFTKELLENLIPFVEKKYRVLNDSKNRSLAGLSMGGLQTLHAGLYHTDIFGYLGVLSSGWFANQQDAINGYSTFVEKNSSTINKNLKLFWIAIGGKEDIAYQNCQNMLKIFDKTGIKYTYYERPGGHTWPVWRDNLHVLAPLLFR
ncbi:MAG: alpha/beta hydrolase-fold protein [Bacteroidales bacterium]